MSREELVELGGKLDGVEIVYKERALAGRRHQGREARRTRRWRTGFCSAAFRVWRCCVIFLFWPWEYKPYGSEGEFLYTLATPLYGLTFGLSILAIGIGAVLFQKKFIPEEISIQDRHDGALPRDPPQDRSPPTSPMRSRARRSSAAS